MPLLVAPVAFQRMAHPDGEVGMARAAKAAGTVMCLSTLATSTPAEVAETGVLRWFQLYVFRDEGVTRATCRAARDAGFTALVLTVDTPVLGRRERDLRTGFAFRPSSRSRLPGGARHARRDVCARLRVGLVARHRAAGVPVGPAGAREGRADGGGRAARVRARRERVVVSNHGGRQLDGVPATIDALEEVVAAVDGRVEVLLDGGIRRGTDVVKALALGARAVLAGRAPLWGLAVDGEAGARRVLELLQAEILAALQLVGCTSPADVTRDRVSPSSFRGHDRASDPGRGLGTGRFQPARVRNRTTIAVSPGQ